MWKFIRVHQVDSDQELIGRVNALQIFSGNVEHYRVAGARPDKDGVKARQQLFDRQGPSDEMVGEYLNAELPEAADLACHNLARQSKGGNSVGL